MKQSLLSKRIYYFLASASPYVRFGFTTILVCATVFAWRVIFLRLESHRRSLATKFSSLHASKAACIEAYLQCKSLEHTCNVAKQELQTLLSDRPCSQTHYVRRILTLLSAEALDLCAYSLTKMSLNKFGYQFGISLRIEGSFPALVGCLKKVMAIPGVRSCESLVLEEAKSTNKIAARCRLSFMVINKETV